VSLETIADVVYSHETTPPDDLALDYVNSCVKNDIVADAAEKYDAAKKQ
jgi:hypothetical protein